MTNNVILYTTSCATTTKQKKDYSKLKHILDVNKYNYEEVSFQLCGYIIQISVRTMCHRYPPSSLPISVPPPTTAHPLLSLPLSPHKQVDLATAPHRRLEMLAAGNDLIQLPQLHAHGHLVGTAEDVQELEDWGELKAILLGTKTKTPKKDIQHQQQALHPIVVLAGQQEVDTHQQKEEEEQEEQQCSRFSPRADPVFTLTEEEEEEDK
jgi:hypothetical protein